MFTNHSISLEVEVINESYLHFKGIIVLLNLYQHLINLVIGLFRIQAKRPRLSDLGYFKRDGVFHVGA